MIEQLLQADRMLQVDQVGKARDIYARVIELDPANAIATVGLARCALADGDDQAAHELAAKALEIDPENDMARRMEARMAEILTFRGEPVVRPEAATTPGLREMRPMVTAAPKSSDASASAKMPAPSDISAPADAPVSAAKPPQEPSQEPSPAGGKASVSAPAAERRSFLDRLMGR